MEAIPSTGTMLVAALDKLYPKRNPRPKDTLSEIMFRAGQRSVVEKLRQLQNQEDD